jgi:hypothetical protein
MLAFAIMRRSTTNGVKESYVASTSNSEAVSTSHGVSEDFPSPTGKGRRPSKLSPRAARERFPMRT